MQLTSADETDLLLPLYAGVHDQREWQTFLERVRRRTGADFASLIFAQGDTPIHMSKEVFAGRDLRNEARALGLVHIYEKDRIPYKSLRPGRVYQLTELISVDAEARASHAIINQSMGISDERIVRIKEQEGTSAWLMLTRDRDHFTAADGSLLGAVAPHVAIALRSFVLAERQRVRSAASQDGLSRAGIGWVALGRDARVIDFDPRLAPVLTQLHGSENVVGDRLHIPAGATQVMAQAAADFAADPSAPPRTVVLRDEPRLDALLVPMFERPEAALAVPVLLMLCRYGQAGYGDQPAMMRNLFDLSPREAQLALILAQGRTLPQAADIMGLRHETARGYLKKVFSKMRVGSQPELVRQVLSSSAWLA